MLRALADCVFGQVKPDAGDAATVPDATQHPSTSDPSPWQGWRGRVHPDAPDGGGGPGSFGYGILGRDGGLSDEGEPHPRSPAARYYVADAGPDAGMPLDAGAGLDAGVPPVNPPPRVTKEQTLPTVLLHTNKTVDIELRGKILPDDGPGEKSKAGKSAGTRLNVRPNLQLYIRFSKDDNKITQIKPNKDAKEGKPKVVIIFSIQTTYQKDADPAKPSGYGRGTGKDIEDGNSSLGFHESCHRNDLKDYEGSFKAYVVKHPFPEFKGKAGMTRDEFKEAENKYVNPMKPDGTSDDKGEVDVFLIGLKNYMADESGRKTDEVFYKKSDFLRDHPSEKEPEAQ